MNLLFGVLYNVSRLCVSEYWKCVYEMWAVDMLEQQALDYIFTSSVLCLIRATNIITLILVSKWSFSTA
ncbi:unnamed protein product [Periconia digitata]|uniref:Uncharacterized protein n=1 Tax=Periconia digitata TaxID=1303443 RepID=A0A9W4UGA8_9PLEO|nr:unnamed protein product [Periconia digitata]